MLAVELYPWHSTGLTAAPRPDPGIVREFVWEPIARWWGACDSLSTPRPLGPLFDITPQAGGELADA